MISLKDGALLKLLEDMKMEENDDPKSMTLTLLQIRSIIPVLEEGDLWPNKGFYLKVSDSSHALYVSLSQEQNDMILGNQLQLGQFIHVQNLQKAHPLPFLRGLGHTATEEELNTMIKEVDSDGDGFIDLQEFIELNTHARTRSAAPAGGAAPYTPARCRRSRRRPPNGDGGEAAEREKKKNRFTYIHISICSEKWMVKEIGEKDKRRTRKRDKGWRHRRQRQRRRTAAFQ